MSKEELATMVGQLRSTLVQYDERLAKTNVRTSAAVDTGDSSIQLYLH